MSSFVKNCAPSNLSTNVTVGPGVALVASLVQRAAGGNAPEEEES